MLKYDHGGFMVESIEELPKLKGKTLYLDCETTSFDKNKMSTNPWHDCYLLGPAVKVDDSAAYYVPVNHHSGGSPDKSNLPIAAVQQWLVDLFNNTEVWVNHNIKYDAHVIKNAVGIDTSDVKKYCTLDLAKLLDSDRYRYGLDALSYDWLKRDISHYEEALKAYLKEGRRQILDYGFVPADVMGDYACMDVIVERDLWHYINANMPPESLRLMENSSDLVDFFLEMERNGMRIDPVDVARQELVALNRMSEIQAEIFDKIGYSIEPHKNSDCFDVLCSHFGLPVLEWTESGNPGFDKFTLEKYKGLPGAPSEIIDLMLEFRRLQTFTSVFTKRYRELHVDGYLHCSYNPTVRTGRSSCKEPNMQQLMKEAKKLIIPREGHTIISCDYSQIEFRVIVHYINDYECIKSYENDEFTDFHSWVQNMCQIPRTPAKTCNFLMGYGGGKAKLVEQLSRVPDLVSSIREDVEKLDVSDDEKMKIFESRAKTRGLEVYTIYHETLPGLKRTSRKAMHRVYERGFVVNLYGRRRKLPSKMAHKAFNSLCQGTAADLMKVQMVELWKWLKVHYPRVKIIGVVHDEVVLEAPDDDVCDHLLDAICFLLEDVDVPIRVPIRTSIGTSKDNWCIAGDEDDVRKFSRENFKKEVYTSLT